MGLFNKKTDEQKAAIKEIKGGEDLIDQYDNQLV